MRNQTKTAVAPRNSKAIAKARRNRQLISPRAFNKLHHGSIRMEKTGDTYFCGFGSILTGKRAHAWGDTFTKAYRNMMRNFNYKYAV